MPAMLLALDHVTLCSPDLARTLGFYQHLLGLLPGPRPSFAVPGCWLCAGSNPVVHVVERPVDGRGGAIDYVAFEARGRAALSVRLDAAGVPSNWLRCPTDRRCRCT